MSVRISVRAFFHPVRPVPTPRTRPTPAPTTLGTVSTQENPFGQVLVALVTPFTADGEVHWGDVEKHIDRVITDGAADADDALGLAGPRPRAVLSHLLKAMLLAVLKPFSHCDAGVRSAHAGPRALTCAQGSSVT